MEQLTEQKKEQEIVTSEKDIEIRNQKVIENMGLVYHVAKRFSGRGYDMEEITQIGSIGLMKAVAKYDVSFDTKFSTYAVYLIQGEILRFLREDGMIKVGRSIMEKRKIIEKAEGKLAMAYNREPTLTELERETGMDRTEIVMAQEASKNTESIEQITETKGDSIYSDEKKEWESERVIWRMGLLQEIKKLSETDRSVLYFRYTKEFSQAQTGDKLQMSQVQVSRREKKILEVLRKQLE